MMIEAPVRLFVAQRALSCLVLAAARINCFDNTDSTGEALAMNDKSHPFPGELQSSSKRCPKPRILVDPHYKILSANAAYRHAFAIRAPSSAAPARDFPPLRQALRPSAANPVRYRWPPQRASPDVCCIFTTHRAARNTSTSN